MSFDFYIATAYAIICIASSYVIICVKKEIFPFWMTFITSLASMIIWSLAVKKTKLPPVELSALFDVVGALAYFVGFAMYGEKITPTQWTGIIIMLFSLYLVNK